MVRINLVPQRREFYDLYNRAAENNVHVARLLVQLLAGFPNDRDTLARDIKDAEHEGDRLTHEVVDLLNRTFVTPFDRDDMFRLASALDDICDHIDEAAGNILGYGVTQIRDNAREQAGVIERAATKLRDAVLKLEGFKDSRRELIELRELEDDGDRLNREGIAQLFASGEDAVSIIRWKDIHEQLEEAVDACENAADVLEAILVKNR
jgi:predicted phosphate transport protein (TIGR00153 family)